MRAIHGSHEIRVFLRGCHHQMRVGFDGRCHHAARIVKTGLIVDDEILRQKLQHHAILRQLDAQGAVHGTVDIALLDFAGTAEFHTAAAVGAPHGEPANAGHYGTYRGPRHSLGFFHRGQHAGGNGLLIGNAALRPSRGRDGSIAEHAQTLLVKDRDHAARHGAARIEPGCQNLFRTHYFQCLLLR